MSELIILTVYFLGAGLFVLAGLILRHVVLQRRVIEQQRVRVKSLRLHKMLEYLGVDQVEYLRKVTAPVIEQQIYRCSQCTNTEICDGCLRDGRCFIDMHFCPNYPSLMAQSQNLGNRIGAV